MCRLYGFIANEPTRLECSLVVAQNSLLTQSDRDGRGRRNADGWGIARWSASGLEVVASTRPAFADRDFAAAAEGTTAPAVIAHVWAATVGDVVPENLHPFRYGPWGFAHNGTLTAYADLAPLLARTAYRVPHGSTDSELIFQWLLGRMPAFGVDPEAPARSLEALADVVEHVVLDLVRAALAVPGLTQPPKLNLIIGDGRHLVASRWGNSLYWTRRRAVSDCAVCGHAHARDLDGAYRAVVIASEPLTDEDWREVPEGTIVGADDRGEILIRDLLVEAA